MKNNKITEEKYVVLKIGGRQYRIYEKEEFLVDKIKEKIPEAEVLLFVDGEKVKIGNPYLKDVKVSLKVLKEEKGEKIDIIKYKSKSRYRRHLGFRPLYTRLLLEKIN